MRRTLVVVLLVLCPVAGRAQQAPVAPQDEAAIVEQARTTVRFDEAGTGTRETYMRVKVLSEAGVQQWGQVVAGYNAATERIDIPLVRVTKADGTKVDTPGSAAQDLTSPVERIAPVYTDFRQKHVTVQSLRPADTLEVRIVATIHTPLAAGQFWTSYDFSDDGIVLDEQIDIDVPAARAVTLRTRPGFDAAVKEAGGRRVYHWARARTVRESEAGASKDGAAKKPSQPEWSEIRLTTFASWAEVGRWFSGLERTARVVSPEIRDKAAELTKGRATDLEKVEALYDYVSKNFRYVSLSLGLGRYQPRAAADVLRDAYGDCKDKHTLLSALLEAAGFKASAALVNSAVKIDPDFPSPAQFDHVITRVVAAGQVIWLDSTPEVAPFRLLSANLRARQALVTGADPLPRLEETPADAPTMSGADTVVDATLDTAGTLKGKVTLTFRGDFELPLRAAFRMVPAAKWQDLIEGIVNQASLDAKVSAIDVSDPQATREPFSLRFAIESTGLVDLSKKKLDLALPLAVSAMQLGLSDEDPIPTGGPSRFEYRLTLRLPDGVKARMPLPLTVKRDYGELRAQYESSGGVMTAVRAIAVHVRELPDARRSDLSSFLDVARTASEQTIGLDATAMTAAAVVAPAAEAKQLNQAGYDALQAGEYERAVDLLKRVVELEPANKTAWGYLGSAYKALRRIDDAIAAYKKQVDVDPYRVYAYTNLGIAYATQGNDADAEAAFLKQLEINPLERYAYTNLGGLYFRSRRFDKAAEAFERAAAIAPDDASRHVDVGRAHASLQNADKAREAFARAVELSPTPGTWNDVSYQMALARIDLDRAQQYAESAVSAITASSRNLDVERADAAAFGVVRSQAAYWDTLGWVHFARGDVTTALRYVAASWKLAEHAEVGDHLGQIYEKLGERDKAIAAYAAAMSARQPAPDVREHLARVAGAAGADDAIRAHRSDATRSRAAELKERGPAGKEADFLILFSAPDKVDSVKFVQGDETMRKLAEALRAFPAAGMFPDTSPARILRRAGVACNDKGACTVTLVLPDDARPVK